MEEPFDAVLIGLMDGIDAQVARLAVGSKGMAQVDLDPRGHGLGDLSSPALVAGAVAQVVEIAVVDAGQALRGSRKTAQARSHNLHVAGPERVSCKACNSASARSSASI